MMDRIHIAGLLLLGLLVLLAAELQGDDATGQELSADERISIVRVETRGNELEDDWLDDWINIQKEDRSEDGYSLIRIRKSSPEAIIRYLQRAHPSILQLTFAEEFPLDGDYTITGRDVTATEVLRAFEDALGVTLALMDTSVSVYVLVATDPEAMPIVPAPLNSSGSGTSHSAREVSLRFKNLTSGNIAYKIAQELDATILARLPVARVGEFEVSFPNPKSLQQTGAVATEVVDAINADLAEVGMALVECQIDQYEVVALPADEETSLIRLTLDEVPRLPSDEELSTVEGVSLTRVDLSHVSITFDYSQCDPLESWVQQNLPAEVYLPRMTPLPGGRYILTCSIENEDEAKDACLAAIAAAMGKTVAYDIRHIDGMQLRLIGDEPSLGESTDAPELKAEMLEDGSQMLTGYTMTDLARLIGERLGCPVEDITGLEGAYTFTLGPPEEVDNFFWAEGKFQPCSELDVPLAKLGLMLLPARVEAEVVTFVDEE